MIEEGGSDQQIQFTNSIPLVQNGSIPYISGEKSDSDAAFDLDHVVFDSQSKLSQEQIEKMDQKIVRQFNRQTTLEDIENPFLTIDEKIKNAMIALKKPIYQRNLKEQKAIIRVIESNNFIQKTKQYNKNLLNQIANCVSLEKIQKGKSVFQYGDRPDKFYLIVKGKVSVLVPKTKNEIAQIKEDIERDDSPTNSIDTPPRKKTNDLQHQTLLLNFPNMGQNKQVKRSETGSDQESVLSIDSSRNIDEVNSPLTLHIKKKSNFSSQVNSERQIRINHNIKRITQGSNFQTPTLQSKKSLFQSKKKRLLEDYQYSEDEKIIPGITLVRSEIFNWKQYFIIEDDITIMKYNHIKFLSDGDIFGDFGLLVRKPRSATILAVQDTILLTIQKSDYENLIREISYVNFLI